MGGLICNNDGDYFWQSVSFDLASHCFWMVSKMTFSR